MVAIYNDRFDMATTLIELGSDRQRRIAVHRRRDARCHHRSVRLRRIALAAESSEQTDGAGSHRLLLDRGADPNKTFAGQFHSTSMPNSDRFDNSPFFRSAVPPDVEALKVFIAHKVDLDKLPSAPAAPAAARARPAAPPAGGRGREESERRTNRDDGHA